MEKSFNQKADDIIEFLKAEKKEVELEKQHYIKQQNYEFAAMKRDKIILISEKIQQLEQLKKEA